MIVFDTNVVSELGRPVPAPQVLAWFGRQRSVAVTAISLAELLYGVARLPDGARKRELDESVAALIQNLAGNVLAFDRSAADHYADILASRERNGRPIGIPDAQIAAICRSRGYPLATRNWRDFQGTGVTVINPWGD